MTHVAVVGSRDYPDLARVRRAVAALAVREPKARLVSGGARGVDLAAEEAALRCALLVYSFRPRRRSDGRYEVVLVERTFHGEQSAPCADGETYRSFAQAAFARNRKIVQHSQRVVAYTTGSRGTAHTIGLARELGIPLTVHESGGATTACPGAARVRHGDTDA